MKLRSFSPLVTLALLALAGEASAYCRLTTCDRGNPKAHCETNADDCVTSGKRLYWPSSCVGYWIQDDGSKLLDIDDGALGDVVDQAFAAWLGVRCDGERPAISFKNRGSVKCDASEFNSNGYNANIVMFRDDEWPYPGMTDTFAFTRVRFQESTGQIVDADIEINSKNFDFSIDGDGDGVDLRSVLTHEAGHFLGLDHTLDDDATMFGGWDGVGTGLSSLANDDEDAVCAIYPADRSVSGKSCDPYNGFADECLDDQEPLVRPAPPLGGTKPRGCTLAASDREGALPALFAALGVAAFVRRRQQSSTRR